MYNPWLWTRSRLSILMLTFLLFLACQQENSKSSVDLPKPTVYEHVSAPEYELYRPTTEPTAVVILFGGYPEVAEDVQREFSILDKAKEKNIALVYSNYNKKLWFEDHELSELAEHLRILFTDNELPRKNIFIGGFSSGGNVALLLGDHLTEHETIGLTPKGLFIIDSPIDMAELYFSSELNLKRNFSEPSIQESSWLIEELGSRFGNPHHDLKPYETYSVFTLKTDKIDNIRNLKSTKIRLYTEPDTLWWKENRMADYEQTNAYLIKQMAEELKDSGFTNVEYLPTEGRGYRANGDRHPHSWAIVETNGLIDWMLNEP